MATTLKEQLDGKRPLVVTGTRSTTTSAMCAWILEVAGLEPGFVLSSGARPAGTRRKLVGGAAKPAPVVVEGHEDCVTATSTVVVTSLEDEALVARVGEDGLIVCDARDARACALVAKAKSRTAFYGLDGDGEAPETVTPTWLGIVVPPDRESGAQPFDVFIGGSACGRFALALPGADNVRSALAALAACAEGFGVDVEKARQALASFKSVPREEKQEEAR